ncbi:MAG: hypothetical protein KDA50_13720 [Rhodobacteraceae bacterium]|nr:hypothetical protein [Paracoccaceae bacterium]
MSFRTSIAVVAGLTLAACAAPGTSPIIAPVVDKILTGPGGTIVIRSDGTMTGKVGPNRDVDLNATWEIRDRQFCRTVLAPAALSADTARTACLRVDVKGDSATFTDRLGRRNTWTITGPAPQ